MHLRGLEDLRCDIVCAHYDKHCRAETDHIRLSLRITSRDDDPVFNFKSGEVFACYGYDADFAVHLAAGSLI